MSAGIYYSIPIEDSIHPKGHSKGHSTSEYAHFAKSWYTLTGNFHTHSTHIARTKVGGNLVDFELLSEITDIEVIASGNGVKIRHYLNRTFGRGRWRKLKGIALIRDIQTDRIGPAEIHWFEAHGIGRKLEKRKRWLT